MKGKTAPKIVFSSLSLTAFKHTNGYFYQENCFIGVISDFIMKHQDKGYPDENNLMCFGSTINFQQKSHIYQKTLHVNSESGLGWHWRL